MEDEELIKEAEKALKELEKKRVRHGLEKVTPSDEARRNPFAYLIVLVLILIIIMMVVPYYGVKLDPAPKDIPSMSEAMPYHVEELAQEMPGIKAGIRSDFNSLLFPAHQSVRNMAARIATSSCQQSDVCYAKAVFYFVRDNLKYVADPPDDYLESPFDTLVSGGADCDGMAILLANLELAVGIPTRFAFIPGHSYVQVKIDDAPKKYKESDGWISLDPTCKHCEFGEVPYSTMNRNKEYLYTS
jgi:Transglutaminase-like superfamily